MRALILKEVRENWRLVLLGGGLSALIMLLYLVLAVTLQETSTGSDFTRTLLAFTPIVLALLVGSTLVANERNRGTLPLLLGLPLSRNRIWLSKVLAGLLLTLLTVLALELPAGLALPAPSSTFRLSAWIPDIAMWMFIGFAIAFLCSVLAERPLHALLAAGLVTGGVFAGSIYLYGYAGGSITGYDTVLDISLWGLTAATAALVGARVTLRKGELLWRGRKWRVALAASLLTWVLLFLVVVGMARLPARYQRRNMQMLENPVLDASGSVLSFSTTASPIAFGRDAGLGWEEGHGYRSQHFVLLDARTGRELAVLPGPHTSVYVSADGRLAAGLVQNAPLTYADTSTGDPGQHLEIWDLSRRTRLYSGRPQASSGYYLSFVDAAWSPDGSWLAVRVQDAVLLLDPSGRPRASWDTLPSSGAGWPESQYLTPGYAWAPEGKAIYLLDARGDLLRQPVPDGASERIRLPDRYLADNARSDVFCVSPDGRWIALVIVGDDAPPTAAMSGMSVGRSSWRLWAIATDGSRAVALGKIEHANGASGVRFAWTGDSRRLLFVIPPRGPRVGPQGQGLMSWSPDETAAKPMPDAASYGWAQVSRVPGRDEVLVSTGGRGVLVDAQLHVQRPDSLALRPDGTGLVGLTREGNALRYSYQPPGLSVIDPKTGAARRLYP